MTALLARVLLAVIMVPAAAIIYTITLVAADRHSWHYLWPPLGRNGEWVVATVVMWCFVATYWLLLWRKTVRWNGQRIRKTLWLAIPAGAIGALTALISTPRIGDEFSYFIFSTVTPLAWLAFTVLAWKETPQERNARVHGSTAVTCPHCGYNLQGLTAARCPECGSTFTLDELFALQIQEKSLEGTVTADLRSSAV